MEIRGRRSGNIQLQDRILDVLERGPKTRPELCKIINIPPARDIPMTSCYDNLVVLMLLGWVKKLDPKEREEEEKRRKIQSARRGRPHVYYKSLIARRVTKRC